MGEITKHSKQLRNVNNDKMWMDVVFVPLKIFKICQNQTTFLQLIHNLKLIQLKLTHMT
jgi:hypothetical protein